MKVEIETAMCAPCNVDYFQVNGKEASITDFGVLIKYPINETICRGCNLDGFEMDKPNEKTMKKYGLSLEDWQELAKILGKEFNYRECTWCD